MVCREPSRQQCPNQGAAFLSPLRLKLRDVLARRRSPVNDASIDLTLPSWVNGREPPIARSPSRHADRQCCALVMKGVLGRWPVYVPLLRQGNHTRNSRRILRSAACSLEQQKVDTLGPSKVQLSRAISRVSFERGTDKRTGKAKAVRVRLICASDRSRLWPCQWQSRAGVARSFSEDRQLRALIKSGKRRQSRKTGKPSPLLQ